MTKKESKAQQFKGRKCSTCNEFSLNVKMARFGFDAKGQPEFVHVCKSCRKHFSEDEIDFDWMPI